MTSITPIEKEKIFSKNKRKLKYKEKKEIERDFKNFRFEIIR
jgi:hypothetical protein